MLYTCENCGTSAEDRNSLCRPTTEEHESKFCGAPTDQVCDDKRTAMRFQCDSCGSVSADAEHLCNPSEIR
jgi:predicted RNA-binding Zn-ribbon protein involved in translation (DUF1610 family)